MTDDSNRALSRRQFAARAAMAALSAAIVPSRALGAQAPSNKLNIAAIGIGGMGAANLKACAGREHRRALRRRPRLLGQDEGALPEGDLLHRLPRDAREGEGHRRGGDRDAGPHARHDHDGRHAGRQARVLPEAADAHRVRGARHDRGRAPHKVVTQMGNQGHSSESMRLLKEWLDAGAIGNVTEVHAWTDRPVGGDPWSDFAVMAGRPTRRRCPRRSTGTCGSGRWRSGRTTRRITR